jgi:Fe-Mn family superoxide dismutase
MIKIILESKKKYVQVPLPVKKTELEPVMSSDTIDYHYGSLYKGYVDKSNKGIGGEFQKAGAFLHNIWFSQFKKPSNQKPDGLFLELVNRKYGSYSSFQKELKEIAMKIQGSGWVYMDKSGNIKTIANHEIKPNIILLIDWWEHAWALDYQADKEDYLDNIYKVIDWNVINARLATEK